MIKEITEKDIDNIINEKVNTMALDIIDYIKEYGNDMAFIYMMFLQRFLNENIGEIIKKTDDKEFILLIKELVNKTDMSNISIINGD